MGNSLDELASYVRPLYLAFKQDCQAASLPTRTEDIGRTPQQQAINIGAGRSWTANSKHLPQPPEMLSEAWDEVPTELLAVKFWGWHGTLESSDERWLIMGQIAEKLGLHWGGRWPVNPPHSRPDPGHLQYQHASNHEAVQDASTGD